MSITSAIVLFAVIWFLTFLVVIPFRVQTQGDLGDVLEGTQAGSPEHHHLKIKAWITTGISAVLWVVVFSVIVTDFITLKDIDLLQYLAQPDFD